MDETKIMDYENLYGNGEHIEHHYRARKFIVGKFEKLMGIAPNSGVSFHFVFEGVDNAMKAVIRQVALRAHFPNFKEDDEAPHRTTLTVALEGVHDKKELESCMKELSGGGCLGNLPSYCKLEYHMLDGSLEESFVPDSASFLDIQIEIVGLGDTPFDTIYKGTRDTIIIKRKDISEIKLSQEDLTIDIRTAKLVNMVYNIGADIDSIPSYDLTNVSLYQVALNVFENRFSERKIQEKWDALDKNNDSTRQKEKKLSNVACADCLMERVKGLFKAKEDGALISMKKRDFQKIVSNEIISLAGCEHARWNVEELILGFRPLNSQELRDFSIKYGKEKDKYRKHKRDDEKAHVDLCSCHDLKRINPNDLKYDYLLMLAIPTILRDRLPLD